MKHLTRWLASALVAVAAFAASVDGKWKAVYESPDGETRESIFTLKSEGDKLTGTVYNRVLGDTQIQDGRVSGNDVTFKAVRNLEGSDVTFSYKGKVEGDSIRFSIDFAGRTFEIVAKRM